ncbi:MAG: hypothetical protein RBR63_05310 [Methanosarcina vacuolata]|jgi:hypothetical protein|nr:hypothetical protein [Methanosarcina vacuolata]
MRSELSKYEGKFIKITAVVGVSSWGKDFGYGEHIKTLCLENVQVHNVVFCHVWVRCSNHFLNANLKPGDKIEFTAQVVQYRTSYKMDWGFATVRNVR